MATNVATLTAKLTADTTGLKSGLASANRDVTKFGSQSGATMGRFGAAAKAGAAAAGVAVAAFAVSSVNAFADFEKGMNEVFTLLPDISEDAMDKMTDQVRDFSKEYGVVTEEVVPALYQAISAGVPKDNVFEFMETATKASIGGVTDLETAVDGLTSVVNAFGKENITAAEASDYMFTAVRLGKTTMDEMARSLFQVNPVAGALGIEFGDITAALAAMTAQGTPTRVATTQLRQALVELGKEGSKAAKVFEDVAGETFPEFIAGGGNVEDAFQLMKGAADNMGVGVGDLFGSVEAGMGIISLTSESGAEAFGTAMDEMQDSAGATEKAFDRMDDGVSRAMDKLKAKFADSKKEMGERLVPAMMKLVEVADDLIPVFVVLTSAVADTADEIVEIAQPVLDIIKFLGDYSGAADDAEGSTTGWGSGLGFLKTALMSNIDLAGTWSNKAKESAQSTVDARVAVTDLTAAQLEAKRATSEMGGQIRTLTDDEIRPYILRTLYAKGVTEELLGVLSSDVEPKWAFTVEARIQSILDHLDLLNVFGGGTPSRGSSTATGRPMLHEGGIVPGPRGQDVAAILQAGEGVIPLSQMGNSSGRVTNDALSGSRTVNVYIDRVETDDLPGDISEGLTRAAVTEQVDLIGAW